MTLLALVLAVQSVMPPPASSIRLTTAPAADGATTVWDITMDRAAALPPWRIESPEPVSIHDVAGIAQAWLKARSPKAEQIEVQNVTFARVGRANPTVDFWYYQVMFFVYGAPRNDPLDRVLVLPDRTVVEPLIERKGSASGSPHTISPSALPPGVYRPDPSNGIPIPRLLAPGKPQYTAGALQHKISGSVLLEGIVSEDGTVGSLRVIRSLDSVYGLDEEAIKAARQYRFEPTMKDGHPVPVMISLQITFMLKK